MFVRLRRQAQCNGVLLLSSQSPTKAGFCWIMLRHLSTSFLFKASKNSMLLGCLCGFYFKLSTISCVLLLSSLSFLVVIFLLSLTMPACIASSTLMVASSSSAI